MEAIARTPHIKQSLGDHRGSYIELNMTRLLRIGDVDVEAPSMKKLQTKDVKSTEKYMEKVEEALLRHRVFERIESLSEKLKRQQGINNEDILE